MPRLGEVDPNAEPYRSEFQQQRIVVFDLTKQKSPGDDAHDRAFEDITSVAAMVRKRLHEGQQMADPHVSAVPSIGNTTADAEHNSSK